MTRSAMTFASVRAMARTLSGVQDTVSWGTPSLKVNGKMLACMAINRSAEPDSLVVRLPIPQRDELIAADPETYYVTPHYEPYPSLLVRLSRVHPDALKDLLEMAARGLAASPRRLPRRT